MFLESFHAIIPTWKNLPSSHIHLHRSGRPKARCFFWEPCLPRRAGNSVFTTCIRKTDSGVFFQLFLRKRFPLRTTPPTRKVQLPSEKIFFCGTILPFGMFSQAVRLREPLILRLNKRFRMILLRFSKSQKSAMSFLLGKRRWLSGKNTVPTFTRRNSDSAVPVFLAQARQMHASRWKNLSRNIRFYCPAEVGHFCCRAHFVSASMLAL